MMMFVLNREIKLWNNEDGRCLENIRTNLKHRSVQVDRLQWIIPD